MSETSGPDAVEAELQEIVQCSCGSSDRWHSGDCAYVLNERIGVGRREEIESHIPRALFVGDYLWCACSEPDWDGQPRSGPELESWIAEQPVFQPEEYAMHVVTALYGPI